MTLGKKRAVEGRAADPLRGSLSCRNRYPRSPRLRPQPAHPQWPGNAPVAVQFVVNFEEGGENNILHGDPASEAFLSECSAPSPGPASAMPISNRCSEYGSRAGFWRLWRMFSARKWPTTVFGVATALKRNPKSKRR